MKLKALKNFWLPDARRGISIQKKIDDQFDLDETELGPLIFEILQTGRGRVVDEKFVPKSGRYLCKRSFSYTSVEGLPAFCGSGKEITLSQETAGPLLVLGHVVPVDDGWTPQKLLAPMVRDGEPKKMFDDLPTVNESWIRRGGH